jgi:8-oxo-dGTP pyrophosphatase MutT (NUDIX family)
VLIRESRAQAQVLMLRRNSELVFAPNNWVFPGGKLDDSEKSHAEANLNHAFQLAACRECLEETNIVISPDSLSPISHWTTPKFRNKRFATQFFIALIDTGSNVVVDGSEIVEFKWLTPTDALKRHQQNQLEMMPPTLVTLTELSSLQSFGLILAYYQSRPPRRYNPRGQFYEPSDGKPNGCFLYEGDSGYADNNPALKTNLNRCELNAGVLTHISNLE